MLAPSIIKHIKKLHEKKYRKEFEEFLIEGVKGIEDALHSSIDVFTLVVDGSLRDTANIKRLIALAEKKDVTIELCGRKDIGDIKTTDSFPGVLAIAGTPETTMDDYTFDLPIICLDRIGDPGNLGTIIRTADWFGIPNILLSEGSVDPYNDKVVRSTMGSLFRAHIVESEHVLSDIAWLKKEQGYSVTGLSLKGQPFSGMKQPAAKTIYVFGSESHGIAPDIEKILDARYTIPGKGKAESLNVAVAAGIVLSHI
ncbi:MAG: RNA methyltransferase [Candidatus Magasanikbacteria bacterium]|nr:RNA methyltransferase [Candidatus Magasanikbacteria bacterium]